MEEQRTQIQIRRGQDVVPSPRIGPYEVTYSITNGYTENVNTNEEGRRTR